MDELALTLAKKKRSTKAEKEERKPGAEQELKNLKMKELLGLQSVEKDQESWENIYKEIKVSEVQNKLEELKKKFNRAFVQKDEQMKRILDEIVTTEEMHKRSVSMQLQMMDYLTDIFRAFNESSKLLYENQALEMLHDFYHEVDEKKRNQHRANLNSESVSHATNLIVEQKIANDYNIFLDKRDDCVNIEVEKRYRLRDSIMKKIEIFQQQLKGFLDSLRNTTYDVHKFERVNTLMECERNFVTETKERKKMMVYNSREYAALQVAILCVEAEADYRINNLKSKYSDSLQMRKQIETEMQQDCKMFFEKLKIVASESFKVLKKYEKLKKYGTLLLSMAANCRKLQTASEKRDDFMELTHADLQGSQFKLQVLNLKTHVDLSEAELQAEMELMKNFWNRQALVEAQVIVLEEKKRHLIKENQQYINTIKQMSKDSNNDNLKETLKIQSLLRED